MTPQPPRKLLNSLEAVIEKDSDAVALGHLISLALSRRRFLRDSQGAQGCTRSRVELWPDPTGLLLCSRKIPPLSAGFTGHTMRPLSSEVSAGSHRPGVRIPRLRQTMAGSTLPGEQWKSDFFTPRNPCAMLYTETTGMDLHRRQQRKRGSRGRVRDGSRSGRLRQRRVPDLYVTQYGRSILYRNKSAMDI